MMFSVSIPQLARIAGVALVFFAGFFLAWTIRGTALEKAEKDLTSIKLDYAADLEHARKEADKTREAEKLKGQEIADGLRKQIKTLRDAATARGPVVKRVLCKAGPPGGSGAGGKTPGSSGTTPGTPSGQPVGSVDSPGSYWADLNLSGIYALGDEGKIVSARLRELQKVCQ
jgi:hypothetical protein